MTTDILKKKTARYLRGQSVPAERKQIQNWLSCTGDRKMSVSTEERTIIENLIVAEVKAYIDYTKLEPEPAPWWKKITAFF
ncbi:MAG: hypothetical protein Q8941_16020 [Bacteroidota bacterium]|nr:hypothetical protein [Bacteroidota bacterium]